MKPIIFLPTVLFCFALFFLIVRWANVMKAGKLFGNEVSVSNLVVLNYKHGFGIVLFFVIPEVLFPSLSVFLAVPASMYPRTLVALVLLMFACTALSLKLSKMKTRLSPFITCNCCLSPVHFAGYIIIRSLFLASYEFFFRGFLLFGCISMFGVVPALFINIILYMLIHVNSEKSEILGCIPFGLVLCYLTLSSGSVLPAMLLHLVLSLVYEIRLYKYYLPTTKFLK